MGETVSPCRLGLQRVGQEGKRGARCYVCSASGGGLVQAWCRVLPWRSRFSPLGLGDFPAPGALYDGSHLIHLNSSVGEPFLWAVDSWELTFCRLAAQAKGKRPQPRFRSLAAIGLGAAAPYQGSSGRRVRFSSRAGQVKSGQVRSQARSGQVRSGQARSGLVRSKSANSIKFKSVRSSQVASNLEGRFVCERRYQGSGTKGSGDGVHMC